MQVSKGWDVPVSLVTSVAEDPTMKGQKAVQVISSFISTAMGMLSVESSRNFPPLLSCLIQNYSTHILDALTRSWTPCVHHTKKEGQERVELGGILRLFHLFRVHLLRRSC